MGSTIGPASAPASGESDASIEASAPAATDPCRGLPGLPRVDLRVKPYRFLARYEDGDADVFFGRDTAIRKLYDAVILDNLPICVWVYDRDGTYLSMMARERIALPVIGALMRTMMWKMTM